MINTFLYPSFQYDPGRAGGRDQCVVQGAMWIVDCWVECALVPSFENKALVEHSDYDIVDLPPI